MSGLLFFELRERWLRMLVALAFQVLITPLGGQMHLQGSSIVLGLVAGFFCVHRDEAHGTGDYVRHRGVSPAWQHVTRCSAFLLAASAWVVWPQLIWHFGLERELGGQTAWYWMSTCTGILSGFGVAVWATSLPVTAPMRLAFGAMACMALLIGLSPLIGRLLWAFALLNIAVFALGALLSARALDHGHDVDVPWTQRGVWFDHAMFALIAMLGVHVFSNLLESKWYGHGGVAQTAMTAVRSPILTAIADGFEVGSPRTVWVDASRLLFVRSGPASLGVMATWSIALLLAGQTAFALRRAGAPRSRAMFWAATIVATGLAGAIVRWSVDPARRWRNFHDVVPDGLPPLFKSA